MNIGKKVNDKNPKFQDGNQLRISKSKNIFAKGYTANWSEEIFVIKKIKNTVPWSYAINDLNGEEIIGTFYEKELQICIIFNINRFHFNCSMICIVVFIYYII